MIEVDLTIYITAADDAEADRVLAEMRDLGVTYPATPIVQINETRREVV